MQQRANAFKVDLAGMQLADEEGGVPVQELDEADLLAQLGSLEGVEDAEQDAAAVPQEEGQEQQEGGSGAEGQQQEQVASGAADAEGTSADQAVEGGDAEMQEAAAADDGGAGEQEQQQQQGGEGDGEEEGMDQQGEGGEGGAEAEGEKQPESAAAAPAAAATTATTTTASAAAPAKPQLAAPKRRGFTAPSFKADAPGAGGSGGGVAAPKAPAAAAKGKPPAPSALAAPKSAPTAKPAAKAGGAVAKPGGAAAPAAPKAKPAAGGAASSVAGAPKQKAPAAPAAAGATTKGSSKAGGEKGAKGGSSSKGGKDNKRPSKVAAYAVFAAKARPALKKEHPEASFGELGKMLGEQWRAASADEKKAFEDAAAAANKDLEARQGEWDAAHPDSVPKATKKKAAAADKGAPKAHGRPPKAKGAAPAGPPAKPKTAYQLFFASRKPEVAQENPGASVLEVGALLEAEWRNMEEGEQAPYHATAKNQLQASMATKVAQIMSHEAGSEDEAAVECGAEGAGLELDDGDAGAAAAEEGAQLDAEAGPTKGKKRRGGPGRKGGRKGRKTAQGTKAGNDGAEEGAEGGDEAEGGEEEEEDGEITSAPEAILAHDYRGKYYVKLRSEENFYSFVFISADKVKQLRAEPQEAQGAAFNGHGAQLLALADAYDAWRRAFEADAQECLDGQAGLNFDLMQPGSRLDTCALLNTLQDKDLGGLLSQRPRKSRGAVRNLEDIMITVPAMMLSMVTQRMVDVWKGRALAAEAQLQQQEGGSAQLQP